MALGRRPRKYADRESHRVGAEDRQRGSQAVGAPADHPGGNDRARQQPDASERLEQVQAELRARLGRPVDKALIRLGDRALQDPRTRPHRVAERRRAQRQRDRRCEYDEQHV